VNGIVSADKAVHDSLAEVCRTQSLQLDAARERIAELESAVATKDAELAGKDAVIADKDKTIAEQRALLARAGSLSERFNDLMQGDGEAVA
jgi:uncharacterized coiled-coil protein SlyX